MAETSGQGAVAERIGAPDQAFLRERLEQLERIHRPSASAGEREAAKWIVERFGELGVDARIEVERAHGTYWWPLGIGAAAGVAAGASETPADCSAAAPSAGLGTLIVCPSTTLAFSGRPL
jgi:acetylornithine deacetylase/succinyl-diaminopimelate desuccinylase-like protein